MQSNMYNNQLCWHFLVVVIVDMWVQSCTVRVNETGQVKWNMFLNATEPEPGVMRELGNCGICALTMTKASASTQCFNAYTRLKIQGLFFLTLMQLAITMIVPIRTSKAEAYSNIISTALMSTTLKCQITFFGTKELNNVWSVVSFHHS